VYVKVFLLLCPLQQLLTLITIWHNCRYKLLRQ
jgi:hypothetical protein